MSMNMMELCKSAELPVEGTCGGMAMCASCHCYVESDHDLPEMSDEAKLAALAADEALEDPALRIHGEVRSLATVERTRPAVRTPATTQLDVFAHDLRQVGL